MFKYFRDCIFNTLKYELFKYIYAKVFEFNHELRRVVKMEFESIMCYVAHNFITDVKEISRQHTESNRIEYSVKFDNRVRSCNKVCGSY